MPLIALLAIALHELRALGGLDLKLADITTASGYDSQLSLSPAPFGF